MGLISANAEDDGQWSQGLISAVSVSIQRKSPFGLFLFFSLFPNLRQKFRQETFDFLLQARMVAAATSNLCEAANASVQGHASEEKLISSAKQVAASTAQLLVACKVKADQDSEAMRRLQVRPHPPREGCGASPSSVTLEASTASAVFFFFWQIAGNAVKKASDNLVRAAQNAAFNKADDDNVVVKTKFVGGIAQVQKKKNKKRARRL